LAGPRRGRDPLDPLGRESAGTPYFWDGGAKEDPTTKFFKALNVFSTCLRGLGVKFIGIPDSSKPNSPANDPDYIKALSTCAAKSNIVQALKDQQTAQDNLTPAQVELQNKGYWLVAADGGVFAFGAPFRGSTGSLTLNKPVDGLVAYGNGYLMVASDGGVFNFSNRAFVGSLGDHPPAAPIVGIAAFVTSS
jgi:hypothetical protein